MSSGDYLTRRIARAYERMDTAKQECWRYLWAGVYVRLTKRYQAIHARAAL